LKNDPVRRIKSMAALLMIAALLVSAAAFASFGAEKAEAPPETDADASIVMSGSTGEVIYGNHIDRKVPMGRTTIYMTAMIVLDNMRNENEYKNEVTISKLASDRGDMFEEGESVTVKDLMYCMMLTGSPEAAYALAEYSTGDMGQFLQQMNGKAVEMGLTGTSYTNPGGVDTQDNYSTALDTALIIQEALRYQEIKELSKLESYEMSATDVHDARTVENCNDLLTGGEKGKSEYKGTIAGMLDTSSTSQSVFAAVAVDGEDMELITVLLGEPEGDRVKDAKEFFVYGFKNVTRKEIIDAGERQGHVRVNHGAKTFVPVKTATKGYVCIPEEGSESLVKTEKVVDKDLTAPLEKGDKVGEIRIYVAEELKGTVDLVLTRDVPVGWITSYLYISNTGAVILGVLLFLFIVFMLRVASLRRKANKEKERRRRQKIREMAIREKEIEEDRRRRNWTYK
jgi:D-alanyl-D-alanine carboxypeptidase (penicillin-binding protein 5/6)